MLHFHYEALTLLVSPIVVTQDDKCLLLLLLVLAGTLSGVFVNHKVTIITHFDVACCASDVMSCDITV